jgi:hypothetical protein
VAAPVFLPKTTPKARAKPGFTERLALAALLCVGLGITVLWIVAREPGEIPATGSLVADLTPPPEPSQPSPPPQPEFRLPTPVPTPVGQLWPRFSLSGLLADGQQDGEGAAVVNGEVVSVGEWVDGMFVHEIGDGGITLEYQGDRKFQGMTEDHKRSVNRPTLLEIYLSVLRNFSFARKS